MPIFACEIRGDAKCRIVRADTAAQARGHLVTAKALKASELADLIEAGATIERADAAGEMPPEPEAEAEPEEGEEGEKGEPEARGRKRGRPPEAPL